MKKGSFHRTLPVIQKSLAFRIDKEKGIIYDIVIINKGEDKHGDNIDDIFLKQIEALGNLQSMGVKSRFGHPNMCSTALGTFIGRYKNFRANTSSVIADLHLDPIAKEAPGGRDYYSYILKMAEKNDDMFGNSIAFIEDDPFEKVNEKGGVDTFIRCKSFLASDLVDSPAATESLFKSANSKSLAETVTEFLDENPDLFEIISEDEDAVKEFLTKYQNYLQMKNKNTPLSKLLSSLGIGSKEKKDAPKVSTKNIQVSTDRGMMNVSDDDNDGAPGPGDSVTDDKGNAVPDTTFAMAEGGTFTTDANSKISAVTPAAAPAAADPAAEPNPQQGKDAEIAKLKSEAEAKDKKISELEASLKEHEDTLPAIQEKVTELQKSVEQVNAKLSAEQETSKGLKEKLAKVESKEDPEEGEQNFNSEKKKRKPNRAQKAHQEREEAEKNKKK